MMIGAERTETILTIITQIETSRRPVREYFETHDVRFSRVQYYGVLTDWRSAMFYRYYDHGRVNRPHTPPHYGIRTDRYKLIYFTGTKEWELFDLQSDPLEMKRLCSGLKVTERDLSTNAKTH